MIYTGSVHRRRDPVIGVSQMALLVAGFIAFQIPGTTTLSAALPSLTAQVQNGGESMEPSENIPVAPESPTRTSVSPFPEVRGTSLVVGLIILAIGGGILLYAKRQ